jgi:CRISPR/Cas system-associated exonuclease Cas4 (RecB family)
VKGKKALVIDYKTGQPDPAKHEVQVSGYMKLMKEMGYSHVEGRLLYLTIPAIVRVKDTGQQ